ncbi:hypothetical protein GCM10010429_27120 [Micromonospora olivasterospora]
MPDRNIQQQLGRMVNPVPAADPVRSVAPMKVVCRFVPWNVTGPVSTGKYSVTTRSSCSPTGKSSGSLSSSAPRFMAAEAEPSKASSRTLPASTSDRSSGVDASGRAIVARPTLTACSP